MRISILNRVQQILAAEPSVVLGYAFGSRLAGIVGPMSDYDFGVVIIVDMDAQAICARLTHEITAIVGTPRVDVVLMNEAPIELAHAMIADGKLIYQKSLAEKVEYEAGVMSRYGDYLPILRRQRADILEQKQHAIRVQRYREAFRRTERTLGQAVRAAR